MLFFVLSSAFLYDCKLSRIWFFGDLGTAFLVRLVLRGVGLLF